jgi:hypothetical protein
MMMMMMMMMMQQWWSKLRVVGRGTLGSRAHWSGGLQWQQVL